jgi:hypothetical protein
MGFNHRAAAWIEDLFNGLDDDEVEVVAKALVFDVHLQDIENNKRTINSAVERINKSLVEVSDREEISKAVGMVSKAAHQNDVHTSWWDARDEKGRFAAAGAGGHVFLDQNTGKLVHGSKAVAAAAKPNANLLNLTATLGHAGSQGNAFSEQWHKQGLDPSNNAQMYNRVEAGSRLLGAATQGSPKAQLIAQAGAWAGKFGPEAEKVIGPSLRRAAYRYRGTERRPDRTLYTMKAKTDKNVPITAEDQAERAEQHMTNSETASIEYLLERLPSTRHSGLQLASGKVPPSEGVIINSGGQIITQAVGYQDDHYLPFNLKNLKGLQGGSYVRSRTTGGLTAEDIYTGLISGARSVTVVSHSGVFTINFDPDFRGGRRFNDKAKQMVDRYEKTLDAVQSKQVTSRSITPEERAQIRDEVETEMSDWGADQGEIEQEIKDRTKKFMSDPTPNKEEIADIQSKIKAEPGSREFKVQRSRAIDALTEQKSRNVYQLDGEGYGVAMEALKEQFPYYIESAPYKHRRGGVDASGERSAGGDALERRFVGSVDQGYVTPRYIRPGAAQSGYYDKTVQGQGKYSAGHENYANWTNNPRNKKTPTGGVATSEDEDATAAKTTSGQQVRSKTAQHKAQAQATASLYQAIQAASPVLNQANAKTVPTLFAVKDFNEEQLGAFIKDVDNRVKLESNLKQAAGGLTGVEGKEENAKNIKMHMKVYENARRMTGGADWTGALPAESPGTPFNFPKAGPAYQPGAAPHQYEGEWNKWMSKVPQGLTVGPDADDEELRGAATLASAVARALKGEAGAMDTVARIAGERGDDTLITRTSQLVYAEHPSEAQVDGMIKQMERGNEAIERLRRLRVNKDSAVIQAVPGGLSATPATPATAATPAIAAPGKQKNPTMGITDEAKGYEFTQNLYKHYSKNSAMDDEELKSFNVFSHAIRSGDDEAINDAYDEINDPLLKNHAKTVGEALGYL